jgi:hypothetical protein
MMIAAMEPSEEVAEDLIISTAAAFFWGLDMVPPKPKNASEQAFERHTCADEADLK